jgi:hypothetical protein
MNCLERVQVISAHLFKTACRPTIRLYLAGTRVEGTFSPPQGFQERLQKFWASPGGPLTTSSTASAGFQGIWRFVSTRLLGRAEKWLRLQMAYDLAQARQHECQIKVKPVARRKLHEPRV